MTTTGEQKPDTEAALYAGAIATGVVALLPYVNVLIFPCYVIGPVVAVWFAVSKRAQSLTSKQAAKLGFLSAFFGSMAAVVLADIIWQFFDYQLWQRQNAQFMIAIFRAICESVDGRRGIDRDGAECRQTVRLVYDHRAGDRQRDHVRNFWNGGRTDHQQSYGETTASRHLITVAAQANRKLVWKKKRRRFRARVFRSPESFGSRGQGIRRRFAHDRESSMRGFVCDWLCNLAEKSLTRQ